MVAEQLELAKRIYSGPVGEKESVAGWDKATIKYLLSHEKRVMQEIRGIAQEMRKANVSTYEVEEIYSLLQDYFYTYKDYDPTFAVDGKIVPLGGYIRSGIRNCVKRYYTVEYSRAETSLEEVTSEDGKGTLGDIIPDQKCADEMGRAEIDLRSALVGLRADGLVNGKDVFIPIYIGLKMAGRKEARNTLMELLGYSKADIRIIQEQSSIDGTALHIAMQAIAFEIEQGREDEAVNTFRGFVPCVDSLELAMAI